MSNKRSINIFVLLFIVLFAIGAVVGYFMYKTAEHEYKLAAYPLKYTEYVEKYADKYGMDKYRLYAYIKTESGFDPQAVSDTGARGLMQIMEDTFDWVKFRLGDGEEVTYDDMFDPETNIRYGAYLVYYLTEDFGNDDTAAAAYFSGIGEVGKWLGDPEYSKDGIRIEKYPSRNAEHYVNKINNAIKTYYELYVRERTDNNG